MIQVYTGNGKGKTTAAVGLALRALGAGKSVFMGQFIKDGDSSESAPLRAAGAVVEQFGSGMILGREANAGDYAAAARGVARAREQLGGDGPDLVILDELNVAVKLGLVALADVLALVERSARDQELIITGRDAPAELQERADLVTEMREIKHYFRDGHPARHGIEY